MEVTDRLQLIQDTLKCLETESIILASEEDAQLLRVALSSKTSKPATEAILSQLSPANYSQSSSPIIKKAKPSKPPEIIQNAPKDSVKQLRPDSLIIQNNINFNMLKILFQKLFPNVAIIDEIPSDLPARKEARRWKTKNKIAPISILHLNEPMKQKKLLCEITKALDIYFGPARLIDAESIEKDKQWEVFLSSEELKFIIVCDYTLWQLTDLMRYYKEMQKTRTLGKIPLILLPDLSLYLKDPLLKRSLWKALCQKLSS